MNCDTNRFRIIFHFQPWNNGTAYLEALEELYFSERSQKIETEPKGDCTEI